MKKNITKIILLALVLVLLLPVLTGCKNSDEAISIRVSSTKAVKDGLEITLESKNNTGYDVSLGWVNSCKIKVTTSDGTYYHAPFMAQFDPGSDSYTFVARGVKGELKQVVITELCLLGNRGLPSHRLNDAVVFDAQKNTTYFKDSFGFFDIEYIAIILIMIVIVGIVIVVIIFAYARNSRAMQSFPTAYGVPFNNTQDMPINQNGFAPPPTQKD